jgi:hypothetical protein
MIDITILGAPGTQPTRAVILSESPRRRVEGPAVVLLTQAGYGASLVPTWNHYQQAGSSNLSGRTIKTKNQITRADGQTETAVSRFRVSAMSGSFRLRIDE